MAYIQKSKFLRLLITGLTILTLVLSVSTIIRPVAAGTLTNASDTIEDSDLNITNVEHLIDFVAATTVGPGGSIVVTFESGITVDAASTSITIATSSVKSGATGLPVGGAVSYVTGQSIVLDLYATITAATQYGFRITAGIDNPSAVGSKTVTIKSNSADSNGNSEVPSTGTDVDEAEIRVAFVDDVTVTATVGSTLTFVISPVASSQSIKGLSTTVSSTTTTIPFLTLTVDTPAIAAQTLSVITNADDGYTVTLEQTQNLTSAGGADIDCLDDGSCLNASGTYAVWSSPAATLGSEATYGHFGFTTEDNTLGGGCTDDEFSTNKWGGLSGSTSDEVMCHDGPADGSTEDEGLVKVGFQVEVSALQEAGDYTNALTYICTPTY